MPAKKKVRGGSVELRVLAQAIVENDDPQRVEQLPLVLVNALDLAVEDRIRIDDDLGVPLDPVGEPRLARALRLENVRPERRVFRQRLELFQLGEVGDPALADRGRDRLREPRIGEAKPASRRDAVGLVVETLGKRLGEVAHRRRAQELGVDRGHAIGAVGADDGQIRHADVLGLAFLDQARARETPDVAWKAGANVLEQPAVDLVDDLEMARNEELHPLDRPALERLGQQRMVGVGERPARDVPRLVPVQMRLVEQNAHELRHGQGRMRIVHLDRRLVGQRPPIRIRLPKPAHDIAERTGDEEIFLHEPQFAPLHRVVVRIKNARQRFRVERLGDRGDEVAAAEALKVERMRGGRAPQPKRVDRLAAVADHRPIVGDAEKRRGAVAESCAARRRAIRTSSRTSPRRSRWVAPPPKGRDGAASCPAAPPASRCGSSAGRCRARSAVRSPSPAIATWPSSRGSRPPDGRGRRCPGPRRAPREGSPPTDGRARRTSARPRDRA